MPPESLACSARPLPSSAPDSVRLRPGVWRWFLPAGGEKCRGAEPEAPATLVLRNNLVPWKRKLTAPIPTE